MGVKIGDIFGRLTVTSEEILRVGPLNSRARQCSCSCGKGAIVKEYNLTIGKSKSCGCGRGSKVTKSTADFVGELKEIYGDRYDFSSVVYSGSQVTVEATCKVHGAFKQTPSSFLAGSSCQQCGWDKAGAGHVISFDEFIAAAKEKHGDKFNYDKCSYVGSTTPMVFTCNTHGLFTQLPQMHIKSTNPCPKCRGKIVDTEDFLSLASTVHAGKDYDYSKVLYKKSKQKVEIVCPTHGSFMQTPHNHVIGKHGCYMCSDYGFKKNIPATLYVLSNGAIIKVGITNRSTSTRVKQINKSSGKQFTLAGTFKFALGSGAYAAEGKILGKLSTMFRGVEDKFDGFSECFYCDDVSTVLEIVEGVVSE